MKTEESINRSVCLKASADVYAGAGILAKPEELARYANSLYNLLFGNVVSKPEASMPSATFGVEVPLVCSKCSKPISVKEKDYSIKQYGKTLCFTCQKNKK
jgi:hypothetical protein